MTSLINNSNSNSALINTINASNSRHNPNVYSTKKIYPAAATTYITTSSSSGSVTANQSVTFDLMKYGIAQQILLVYKKTTTSATGLNISAFDFLNVIDRVELLSSSKVVDTLTKYDLLSQFSNLERSQYNIVERSLIGGRTGTGATNILLEHTYVCPLVFGFFKDINTNLNLQFNEPMSIRVRWGGKFTVGTTTGGGAAANVTIPSESVNLKMRFKAYNEADFSEILSQNYSEPEMNQLSSGYYDEPIVQKTLTAAAGAASKVVALPFNEQGAKVELKNTDCVNDFYVTVIRNGAAADTDTQHAPVQINRVRMTASGQEIFDLSYEELFYSRLCENGNAILCSSSGTDAVTNIVKIQTGLWEYSGSSTQSNTMSLRELNNPVIEIWFQDTLPANGTGNPINYTYDCIVCEDAVKIYATTSSTGRLTTALTN